MKLKKGQRIETRTFRELVQIIRMLSKQNVFTFKCLRTNGWWLATVTSVVRIEFAVSEQETVTA